ncbi:MAG: DUF4258 domain-containing protein [Gemmatimonadales bacterium]
MADDLGLPGWVLTDHARNELIRRALPVELVRAVVADPAQRRQVRPGREVWQSRLLLGAPPSPYLIRVIVDVDRWPKEVVTAYRTSKLAKYWREP